MILNSDENGMMIKRKTRNVKLAHILDLLKYPLAIILFNLPLYLWLKYWMLNNNLQIFFKETLPKFH